MTSIPQMLANLEEIKRFLQQQLKKQTPAPVAAPVTAEPPPSPQVYSEEEVSQAVLSLVRSNSWPAAVPAELICDPNNENDKIERGEAIISSYLTAPLTGKKFLDFGCGEGHVIKAALKHKPILAVGYDPTCEKTIDGAIFTNDLADVQAKGPYDVILLYDVLDHVADPVEVLNQVRALSHKRSKIFVRCHPWCSRHAGHLYQKMNKAFIHFILTDKELAELGCKVEQPHQSVIYPIRTYGEWVISSGLRIDTQHSIERMLVEPFFKNDERIRQRILSLGYQEFPQYQMEQCFFDIVLKL